MAELQNIQQLPDFVRADVERFLHQLIANNPQKVISIYVYGSIASGNFIPKVSDINLMVVVDSVDMDFLTANLGLVQEGLRKRISAPLFLTEEHIARSQDVFPIEFLDMKEHHVFLYGKAVLRDITVDISSLRLFCEQQVKGKLIRIRQAYLENGLNAERKQKILQDALKALFPVLQNLLRLKGQTIPASKIDVLKLVGTVYNVNLPNVIRIYQDSPLRSNLADIVDEGIKNLILLLEKLAVMVDESV